MNDHNMGNVNVEQVETMCDSISKYVSKCFMDAYSSEQKEYHDDEWNFDFIIVYKKSLDQSFLFPVNFWCKYSKVERRVKYRIKWNLYKNFHVHFVQSDDISIMMYKIFKGNESLDPNHIIAKISFKNRSGKDRECWLSAVNRNYEDDVDCTKVIPAKTLYQLILTYYDISDEKLNSWVNDKNGTPSLPQDIMKDWGAFRSLYNKAFGKDVDSDYTFQCSNNVEVLYK